MARPAVKKALFAVTVILAAFVLLRANLQVRATPGEAARPLAGDEFIPQPIAAVSHAITIHRPPRDVWPWLAQMGSDRAGWYAYDFIDNGGRKSAEQILPQFQKVEVGTVFPALPGAKDTFVVVRCDVEKSLVLAWRTPDGRYRTTWAFALEQPQSGETRLIVRGRIANGYHPLGLPQWLAMLAARPAHFIMQRKQLLGVRRRAEAAPDR